MTTVCYDHTNKKIAIDGRIVRGTMIVDENSSKWREVGEQMWFFCGQVSDEERLVDHIREKREEPPAHGIDCSAIVVCMDGVYLVSVTEEGEGWSSLCDYSEAVGSGEQFAIAALDFGKSAKEAVEYAATRDCCTGLTVNVYDIPTGKFE